MSDILVALERILPNPYQTRMPHDGDDEHVQALAADIQQRGLLQVPLGRLVTNYDHPEPLDLDLPDSGDLASLSIEAEGCFVQLAFGHHRLAAFRHLARDGDPEWIRMPVRIADLDDQAMALAAWSENAARKDLSPLEAARALERLLADFGWTQEQVAEHVGLARATVANKLRLLRLPEELQGKLHDGTLSERQALAILPIYDLPPTAQRQLIEVGGPHSWDKRQLDDLLKHPDKASSSDVRQIVRGAIRSVTDPLSTAEADYGHSWFPVDRPIEGVAAPACLECPNRLLETRCADPECRNRKEEAFERAELAFAAAATGLSIIGFAAYQQLPYDAKDLFGAEDKDALQRALERKCPCLRLRYTPGEPRSFDLRVPDYPFISYVCIHEGQEDCPCQEEGAAEEQRKAAAKALQEATVKELVAALRAQDVGAWRAVLWALGQGNYNPSQAEVGKIKDLGTLCEKIARAVVKSAARWDWPGQDVARDLAAWRKKVGWPAAAEEATPEE